MLRLKTTQALTSKVDKIKMGCTDVLISLPTIPHAQESSGFPGQKPIRREPERDYIRGKGLPLIMADPIHIKPLSEG